jgi:hypothetical protein
VVDAFAKGSPVTVHRRRFLTGATAAAGSTFLPEMAWPATPTAGPPRSYDLRDDNDKNYITAIKDQEDPLPCNACTAFAIAAAIEGTFNKKNQLTGSPGTLGPNLDEMELFLRPSSGADDVASGGCGTSHWWPKYALARCKSPSPGILYQGSSPARYLQIDFKSLLSEDTNLSAKKNLEKTQADMKCWIHSKGPVVAVMVQYEDLYAWGKVWGEQHPGIPNPHVYAPGKILSVCTACPPAASVPAKPAPVAARKRPRVPIVGGHVVAIVGYDGNKSWICKNSWGSEWNGDGYVLIEQGDVSGSDRLGVGGCYIDLIDVWGVFLDTPTCT